MEELAEQRLIIDIDLAPNVDDVYTGKCLVANSEIVMLLNFDEEDGEFYYHLNGKLIKESNYHLSKYDFVFRNL